MVMYKVHGVRTQILQMDVNERSTHRRDANHCVSTTCTSVIPNAVRNPREEEKRFIADTLNDKESALNDRVEERAVHVGANLCVHPS